MMHRCEWKWYPSLLAIYVYSRTHKSSPRLACNIRAIPVVCRTDRQLASNTLWNPQCSIGAPPWKHMPVWQPLISNYLCHHRTISLPIIASEAPKSPFQDEYAMASTWILNENGWQDNIYALLFYNISGHGHFKVY